MLVAGSRFLRLPGTVWACSYLQRPVCGAAPSEAGGPCCSTSRPFAHGLHSSSHDGSSAPDDEEALRQRLLAGALAKVPQYGWSHAALVAAAREQDLSPAVTGIVPRREGALVEHFIASCNRRLAEQLAAQAQAMAALRTHERVQAAVRMRLEMLVPHLDSWPQALAIAARPENAPSSLALLGQLVDDIWHAAGDTSTDINWYTKRGLLAGVYTATEVYMLTDTSPGYEDTWQALERRLGDVAALGKAGRQAGSMLQAAVQQAAAAAAAAAAATAAGQPRQHPQQQQHRSSAGEGTTADATSSSANASGEQPASHGGAPDGRQ